MELNAVILESESRYGFRETIARIEQQAASTGWKIPTSHDLQETLRKAAIDVPDVTIMELCKPTYAGVLMREDATRYISALMPCRISVYMKSDKKTYVSRLNAPMLSMFLGGEIGTVLGQSGHEMESLLKDILVEEPLPDF